MSAESDGPLAVVNDIVGQFGLASLRPALAACEGLASGEPIDVAVLGQFKSGKSSLLNAVLVEAVFPVGALPVTAVITRAAAGPERVVRVTNQDGSSEEVVPARLAEFVTEAGNPGNQKRVAVVDLRTQASAWVDAELGTLDRLLGQQQTEASTFRAALARLEGVGATQPG